MRLGQKAEEGDIESTTSCVGISDLKQDQPNEAGIGSSTDNRGKLKVVANKHECVGNSQRAQAGGEGDLRGFIHDAVVELATVEEWTGRHQRHIESASDD